MTALLALAAALGVALAYIALSDRLEAGALARRQLDAWAVVLALACLGGIVYGGADTWLRAPREVVQARSSTARPRPAVERLRTPDLTSLEWPSWQLPAAERSEALDRAPAGAPAATQVVALAGSEALPATYIRASGRRRADPARAPNPASDVPLPAGPVRGESAATPTATTQPRPIATATPRAVVWPTPTSRAVPSQAPIGPTIAAPTEEPPPLPTATPFCGDPEDIALHVERVTAGVDRSGSETVVHYVVRVRNETDFPATMADVVITAVSHSGSSEQYGHVSLPDMALAPGAVIDLDGSLTLVKSPPPFGTTDLCVSFVGESCGRRPAYRVTRQCTRVNGF